MGYETIVFRINDSSYISFIIYKCEYHRGFDYEGRKDDQRKFLKDNDKYWDSRLFPQVVKGVDKESRFVELSKDKTKLDEISPTSSGKTREIGRKIENCKLINETGECGEIDANECGYCWDTDKIIYGNKDG